MDRPYEPNEQRCLFMLDKIMLSGEEIEKHNSRQSCWIVIHSSVYDVTEFLDTHPGGAQVLLRCAGRDATNDFDAVHDIQILTQSLAPGAFKGNIEPGTLSKLPEKATRKPQIDDIPPLSSIINLHDFEEVARRHLLPTTWAYFASGADDEASKHGNAKAYQKVSLRPRILRKILAVDTSTHILGHAVSLPVYMSPVGIVKLAHPDGECALAAAAGQEGLVQVLANGSSIPVEKVMDSRVRTNQPIFCQLYVNRDIRKSEDMVRRAEKAGARAIWLTVDSPVVGKRELDERMNLNVQPRYENIKPGAGVAKTNASTISPFIDWDILTWLRNLTHLPIVIKGIQCVEDAVQAYESGVQGIVLSNHGGRSQDTAQAPLLTLLEIRRYAPYLLTSPMQIFVDGGIRRGTDVLKAIALGATAVGLGRPFLYSMAAGYGEDGARRAIDILRQEIEANMVFLGVTRLSELGQNLVNASRLERDVVGSVKL